MAKFLERDTNFARQQARTIANAKFETNDRRKINKTEYTNVLESMFINGELLMLTTVRQIFQNCETISREDIIGELIELESAVKNQVSRNKLIVGKRRISYVEDIHKQNDSMIVKGV